MRGRSCRRGHWPCGCIRSLPWDFFGMRLLFNFNSTTQHDWRSSALLLCLARRSCQNCRRSCGCGCCFDESRILRLARLLRLNFHIRLGLMIYLQITTPPVVISGCPCCCCCCWDWQEEATRAAAAVATTAAVFTMAGYAGFLLVWLAWIFMFVFACLFGDNPTGQKPFFRRLRFLLLLYLA